MSRGLGDVYKRQPPRGELTQNLTPDLNSVLSETLSIEILTRSAYRKRVFWHHFNKTDIFLDTYYQEAVVIRSNTRLPMLKHMEINRVPTASVVVKLQVQQFIIIPHLTKS